MSKFWKLSIGMLLASTMLLCPVSAKPSKDDAIARVYDVQGKKLEVQRAGGSGWDKTKKDSAGFIQDHFRTDSDTSAALELLIGARVGIKKGSEIVLLGEGDAATVEGKKVRKIVLNKGGVFAKFHKQEKPGLQIQTRGGVMGIKGTEFSVDTTESGQTDVTLLEGSVDYTDNKGEKNDLKPGQKLSQFEKDGELYVVKGEPSEVDKAVNDFLNDLVPIANLTSVQGVLNTNWANLGPDAVNSLILRQRDNILGELPPVIGDLVNSWVPSVPSLSSWGSLNYPGISFPGISLPGGIRF